MFMRYVLGITLVVLGVGSPLLWYLAGIGLLFYLLWAFRKVYLEFRDWKVGMWGPIIQIYSDFAVMSGFISGMLGKNNDSGGKISVSDKKV